MTSTNVAGVMQVQNLIAKVEKLSDDIGTGVDFTKLLQGSLGSGAGDALPAAPEGSIAAAAPSVGTVSYEKEQSRALASKDQISSADGKDVQKMAEPDEKLKSDAKELDSSVKKAVAEATDTTEEDVEKAMEELGLTAADLINPANLAELVSKLTGTEDTVELLMSDTFTELTAQITDIFNDLAQQNNMPTDEFTQVMSRLFDTEAVQEEIPDLDEAGPFKEASDAIADTADRSESAVITQHVTKTDSDGETEVIDTAADGKETSVIVNTAKADESEKTPDRPSDEKEDGKKEQAGPGAHEHVVVEARVEGPRMFEVPQQQPEYTPQTPVNTQEIIDRIVEQTRISYSANQDTSIEMILNPEELGRLILKVASDKNGQMSAHITVQNEDVREALMQQMATLKEAMNGNGVKIDAIEVTVSSHAFEENLEKDFSGEEQMGEQAEKEANKRRGINLNDLDSLQGLMTEEEQLVASMMADQGNTMNVTA